MTSGADTVRECVALVTGCLQDPEPHLDRCLDVVVADLGQADPIEIIAYLSGIAVSLVNELALVTGDLREDVWRRHAHRITQQLTEGNQP